MATSNMKAFNEESQDVFMLEYEREAFLLNCATGIPTPNEKLAADYINELNLEIKQLYKQINGAK